MRDLNSRGGSFALADAWQYPGEISKPSRRPALSRSYAITAALLDLVNLHWRYLFSIVEDMGRDFLGGVELLVLLALIKLGDDAYGVTIAREIQASSGRSVAVGSLYLTLKRLEEKQLVSSRRGEPTAERGGRAKTFFRVTAKGLKAATHAQRTLTKLWQGVPLMQGEGV